MAERPGVSGGIQGARALIEARAKAGLTQAAVAKRMGTTQSVVARIESGRAPPNLKTLEKYARPPKGYGPRRAAGVRMTRPLRLLGLVRKGNESLGT